MQFDLSIVFMNGDSLFSSTTILYHEKQKCQHAFAYTGAIPPYPVEHRGTRHHSLIIRRIFCGLGENEKNPLRFPGGDG